MAEAKQAYHNAEQTISEYRVGLTLARYRAKQIVKDDWRRKGHKLAEVSAADVVGWADDYIKANPQLLEEAIATVRTDPKLRTLVERQARWARRNRR
jgi:hypothetical protein